MFGHTTSADVRNELHRMGFERSAWTRWGGWVLFWGTIVVALGAAVTSSQLPAALLGGSEPHEIGGAIFATGAFYIAYRQWIANRQEISLDKFYDRLDRANHVLEKCESARTIVDGGWSSTAAYHRGMYACTELDNLEYAITKYAMGYMDSRDAYRALTTFSSRCSRSVEFQRLVEYCVAAYGYRGTTRAVVDRVLSEPEASRTRRDLYLAAAAAAAREAGESLRAPTGGRASELLGPPTRGRAHPTSFGTEVRAVSPATPWTAGDGGRRAWSVHAIRPRARHRGALRSGGRRRPASSEPGSE